VCYPHLREVTHLTKIEISSILGILLLGLHLLATLKFHLCLLYITALDPQLSLKNPLVTLFSERFGLLQLALRLLCYYLGLDLTYQLLIFAYRSDSYDLSRFQLNSGTR
jgi:hypothetical protein